MDAQGQVSIKGTGSAEVSITMADGTNYLGTSTAAKETITIEKGTLTLTLTAVNRSTGVQQPEGILGTYEDDFDIIASIQGAYDDKLQGMIHFYDNGNQNPDTIPVGEAGTAVLNLPKPGVASVGTHRMTAEFDFDTHQEWAAKYNTPAPAAFTFTIGKVAAPQKAAAAISIIGGADGPTSIFLAGKLGQTDLMGPIAVAAYSYMSLVPIIQPPIMKLLTTEKERKIKMEQLRPVTKLEKILFPIIVTIVVVMILPTTAPLVGMLMLGNLFRESGVVRQLTDTASNALMYIVVILLGTSVGATTSAEAFLNLDTLKIVALGLIAFAFGTAAGVLFGKLMCVATKGKVNPLIGSAGVSAVPMAARVSQKVGAEADPTNFLLMHAMGPNVAGVIGTAVAAGTFMAVFGVF